MPKKFTKSQTDLIEAIKSCNVLKVRDIFESKTRSKGNIDLNILVVNDQPILHYFMKFSWLNYKKSGYLEIIKLLVNNGANVNLQDAEGNTPLHVMKLEMFNMFNIYRKHPGVTFLNETLQFFCENEFDIFIKNKDKVSLFSKFVKFFIDDTMDCYIDGNIILNKTENEIIRTILKFCKNKRKHLEKYLNICKAIEKNDQRRLRTLIDNVKDVDFEKIKDFSPLVIASILNCPRVVKILLENGASLEPKYWPFDDFEFTEMVIKGGYTFVAKAFFDEGLDVNKLYQNGSESTSSLEIATLNEDLKLIEILTKKKVDITRVNINNRNCLHVAAIQGKLKSFQYFLEHDYFNVDTQDEDNNTALHLSQIYTVKKHSQCKMFCLLLENCADINIENDIDSYPEHSCHKITSCPVVEYFKKMYLIDTAWVDENIEDLLPDINDSDNDFDDSDNYDNSENETDDDDNNDNIKSIPWNVFRNYDMEKYMREIDVLKKIKISNRHNLFDFLFFDKATAIRYARNINTQKLWTENSGDLRREFPYYGFLLNYRMKRIFSRYTLMQSAINLLEEACGSGIPLELSETIFQYFHDSELCQMYE